MSPKCFQKRKSLAPDSHADATPQSFRAASDVGGHPLAAATLAITPQGANEQAQNGEPRIVQPRLMPNSSPHVPSLVRPPAPRCVLPPPPLAGSSGSVLGESLVSNAPRIVLPPASCSNLGNTQIGAPTPRIVLPPAMPPLAAPHVVVPRRLEELKERLVKRRRTEDLERPPGDFGPTQPKERTKNADKVPLDRPPGDCSASVRPSHRKHRHKETRDRNHDKDKVCDGHHGPDIDANSSLVGSSVSETNNGATHPSKSGLTTAPWRAKVTQPVSEATEPKLVSTTSQTAPPIAPWRRSAPEASSSVDGHCLAQPSAALAPGLHQDTLSSGGASGSLAESVPVELPDLGELLRAVDQVTTDVVASSPENLDEGSATEDSATEDTDYDPFEAGSEAPQADDGEDEGIVEALFEILRSAEQTAAEPDSSPFEKEVQADSEFHPRPDPGPSPALSPRSAAPAKEHTPQASAPKEIPTATQKPPSPVRMQEEEELPKQPKAKTTYVFNATTQRWEPKKVALAQEQRSLPKTAPAKSDARAGSTRATIFVDDEPPIEPRPKPAQAARPQQNVIAECEKQAKADIVGGVVTFPQALAVRLALRFESKPEQMLKTMEEAGLPAAKDQRSTVKAIMRLCHPDKCKHPLAKRAMQAMGPLL